MSDPYLDAVRRGLSFASELGQRPGSVHLLVGISLGDGPMATVLGNTVLGTTGRRAEAGHGRSLREVVAAAPAEFGASAAVWQHIQAQEAAREFAAALGQPRAPEHLLVALLDQGVPEIQLALERAGIDPAATRAAALAAVGADAGLPPLAMPAPMPAGTMDRAPLPVERLDARAWRVLCWRQDHLPLGRLRRRQQAASLSRLEDRAALRLADRLGLDDDQRYSLLRQHADQVRRRVAEARPDLADPLRLGPRPGPRAGMRRRPGRVRRLTVGWGAWLENRRTGLRDRWLALRTRAAYRGCPQA
jgi:hypothetical protein